MSDTTTPVDFGPLELAEDDGGPIATLEAPESDHRGDNDPVPHAIRWLEERGWSAPAYRHVALGGGRCRFIFYVARMPGGKP